jgi:hypothetical protein
MLLILLALSATAYDPDSSEAEIDPDAFAQMEVKVDEATQRIEELAARLEEARDAEEVAEDAEAASGDAESDSGDVEAVEPVDEAQTDVVAPDDDEG